MRSKCYPPATTRSKLYLFSCSSHTTCLLLYFIPTFLFSSQPLLFEMVVMLKPAQPRAHRFAPEGSKWGQTTALNLCPSWANKSSPTASHPRCPSSGLAASQTHATGFWAPANPVIPNPGFGGTACSLRHGKELAARQEAYLDVFSSQVAFQLLLPLRRRGRFVGGRQVNAKGREVAAD